MLNRQQWQKARRLLRKLCAIDSGDARSRVLLGAVNGQLGMLDEAESILRQAIQIDPELKEAHYNLGNALKARGQLHDAGNCFRKAIEIDRTFAAAHGNLANILHELGLYEQAVLHHQLAAKLEPESALVYYNLGKALISASRSIEAIAAYEQAVRLQNHFPEAYYNLGLALRKQYRLMQAEVCFRTSLEQKPQYAKAHHSLATVLYEQRRFDESFHHFDLAMEIDPEYTDCWSAYLLCLNGRHDLNPNEIWLQHRKWGLQHSGKTTELKDWASRPHSDRPLRIGYISGDFRSHSVGFFIEPIIEKHNKNGFTVFCYSNSRDHDAVTQRIRKSADHWLEIRNLDDGAVVEQIQRDEIDILVDLSGHTEGNRLLVFAQRAAPLQVTYLGYPNTTGLRTMDYRITDSITDPPGTADSFTSERISRMPNTFLCYRPPSCATETYAPPCVTTGGITFGSFNNVSKSTTEVIAVWADILRSLPGSRLILKSRQLEDDTTARGILGEFEKLGVETDRISTIHWVNETLGHLREYRNIDLGLDPFPYNGTTTTCEALWMGVPVVTLCGDRHSARVGASLLTAVGLTECIAATKRDYVELVLRLAGDRKWLETTHRELRDRMKQSALMDEDAFVLDLETEYRRMWKDKLPRLMGN